MLALSAKGADVLQLLLRQQFGMHLLDTHLSSYLMGRDPVIPRQHDDPLHTALPQVAEGSGGRLARLISQPEQTDHLAIQGDQDRSAPAPPQLRELGHGIGVECDPELIEQPLAPHGDFSTLVARDDTHSRMIVQRIRLR